MQDLIYFIYYILDYEILLPVVFVLFIWVNIYSQIFLFLFFFVKFSVHRSRITYIYQSVVIPNYCFSLNYLIYRYLEFLVGRTDFTY